MSFFAPIPVPEPEEEPAEQIMPAWMGPNEENERTMAEISGHHRHGLHVASGQLPLGVELPGGEQFDSHLPERRLEWDAEPQGASLLLSENGGFGRERRRTSKQSAWLWPMPAPGIMTLHYEYPVLGVAGGTIELDTREFTRLATQVVTVEAVPE